MLRFLIWLILGLLLLLSSCTQTRYSTHAYRLHTMNHRAENLSDAVEPAISYSDRLDTFYNDDFRMSFEEDLETFYGKVDTCARPSKQAPAKLSGRNLYRALSILDEPEKARDMSPLRQLALHTERPY